jgi:HAD superfamily hydrolase (TIGR01549 family)
MIRCIYIDGYNTIENGSVFEYAVNEQIDEISSIIGCKRVDVVKHSELFSAHYNHSVWEYHEIFWRSLIKKHHLYVDENLLDHVYDKVLDFYEAKVELFDGTLNAIKTLSMKVKLILVANANSKRIKRLIRKYRLSEYFTDFVISSETPYNKPDKFLFEYGLKMYGWLPEEVLMIGDRYDTDVKGAKKCGLLTAILLSKCSAPADCSFIPDFTVNSLDDLHPIIDSSQTKTFRRIEIISNNFKATNDSICGFIAAGGKGHRLGEIGKVTQKCMLDLWGKPMIYYTIVSLKNAGCSKIFIAVNHLSEQIEDYFGDGSSIGVQIEYLKDDTKGTYDAIYKALGKLKERIVYLHANILFQNQLLENLIKTGNDNDRSIVSVIKSDCTNIKHAHVKLDEERRIVTTDLIENNCILPFTFLGAAYYKKKDIKRLFDGNIYGMVEKVLQQLIDEGKQKNAIAYQYDGRLMHIETELDYKNICKQKVWDVYFDD